MSRNRCVCVRLSFPCYLLSHFSHKSALAIIGSFRLTTRLRLRPIRLSPESDFLLISSLGIQKNRLIFVSSLQLPTLFLLSRLVRVLITSREQLWGICPSFFSRNGVNRKSSKGISKWFWNTHNKERRQFYRNRRNKKVGSGDRKDESWPRLDNCILKNNSPPVFHEWL